MTKKKTFLSKLEHDLDQEEEHNDKDKEEEGVPVKAWICCPPVFPPKYNYKVITSPPCQKAAREPASYHCEFF